MKVLDQHNINELSKILYQTNLMPSGNSRSFSKLSKKLILDFQDGYELEKIKRVIACSRLLLKILTDFQFGVYLQSFVLTHATTHSRRRYAQRPAWLEAHIQERPLCSRQAKLNNAFLLMGLKIFPFPFFPKHATAFANSFVSLQCTCLSEATF